MRARSIETFAVALESNPPALHNEQGMRLSKRRRHFRRKRFGDESVEPRAIDARKLPDRPILRGPRRVNRLRRKRWQHHGHYRLSRKATSVQPAKVEGGLQARRCAR